MNDYSASERLSVFVSKWERLELRAYLDRKGGKWTIGYGHTAGVQQGDVCTEVQALAWLREDLATAARDVRRLVRVPISESQFHALQSFLFNLGNTEDVRNSSLLRFVNGAQIDKAAIEFTRWCHDGGQVMRGLLARRAGEQLMYTRGEYENF